MFDQPEGAGDDDGDDSPENWRLRNSCDVSSRDPRGA